MDIRKVKKLIELIDETGVHEIEIHEGEESVRISRMPANAPVAQIYAPQPVGTAPPAVSDQPTSATESTDATADVKPTPTGHEIKSPMVGTAYLASAPGEDPFVEVGQQVEAGDTICLIEAMKMYNQIEADKAGVISARLVENGQPVEYDQVLFIIE